MARWLSNWWAGRKKVSEKDITLDGVVELLSGINKQSEVYLAGGFTQGVIFKSTGEGFNPQCVGADFSETWAAKGLAGKFPGYFKPYSEEHWHATHIVYSGKGMERHYIDFASTAPVKQMGLATVVRAYCAALEFTVNSESQLNDKAA